MRAAGSFRTCFILAGAGLLGSCAGQKAQLISVVSINTQEENIPCVIYVDNELVKKDGKEVLTPASGVPVTFHQGSAGFENVKLEVKPVEVDQEGKITKGLRPRETVDYVPPEARDLQQSDAKKQVFILRKRRAGS